MSELSMPVLFGELRALMQGDTPTDQELLSILQRAFAIDPERYLQEWRPYLEGFELPMFRAVRGDMLELFGVLLPESAPREFFCANQGLEGAFVELLPTLTRYPCRNLVLFGNNLGDEGLMALVNSSALRLIERLDASSNAISNEGLIHLSSIGVLPHFRALDLGANIIEGADGVSALMRSTMRQSLHMLNLSQNPLGPEGGQAFATGEQRAGALIELGLSGCELGDVGLSALMLAPFVGQLKGLHLGFNQLVADESSVWRSIPNVQRLNLQHNALTFRCVEHLAHLSSLESLRLTNNRLGDMGAQAIAATAQWSNLNTLDLSHTSVGDDGLIALAGSMGLASARHLMLDHNNISARGLRAFAQSDAFPHLETLSLMYNDIDPEDAQIIRSSEVLPRGLRVHVAFHTRHTEVWEAGSDVS